MAPTKGSVRLNKRRQWTIEEDRLMLMQSQGRFTMHQLEKAFVASRESIVLRMEALGLTPVISKRHSPHAKDTRERYRVIPPPAPGDAENYAASPDGPDRELRLLYEHHGERRYEALDLRRKTL